VALGLTHTLAEMSTGNLPEGNLFFVTQFYMKSVPVHSANCVKNVFNDM
jgi:hypothetical protein